MTVPERTPPALVVAGVVESSGNDVLIVLPPGDADAPREWRFPRGAAKAGESPEAATRRLTETDLGLGVEIVVGQPPLFEEIHGRRTEVRYFFCAVAHGSASPGTYREIRWVPRAHLREYDFDAVSRPVVGWLLDE